MAADLDITTASGWRLILDGHVLTVRNDAQEKVIYLTMTDEQRRALADALRGPKPSDDLYSVILSQAGHVHDLKADLADMARERDEWKARAEQAEQLIPRYAMLDIWVALGRDSLHFDDWYDEHGYADAWAELTAAVREARTAPTVTRADIEKALRASTNDVFQDESYPHMAGAISELFGVEAEQAVDPVDALADILYPEGALLGADVVDALERVVRAGMLFPGQEADQ